jgi:hypothetical protein
MSGGQGFECEYRCGGAVVHGGGRFGAGQRAEVIPQHLLAGRAFPGGQREFEAAILRRGFESRLGGGLRERRPAEIGMQHDAGSVDDAAEQTTAGHLQTDQHGIDEVR